MRARTGDGVGASSDHGLVVRRQLPLGELGTDQRDWAAMIVKAGRHLLSARRPGYAPVDSGGCGWQPVVGRRSRA